MNLTSISIIVVLVSTGIGGALYVETKKADKLEVAGSIKQERMRDYKSQLRQVDQWIRYLDDKVQSGKATPNDRYELKRLREDRKFLIQEINLSR